MGKKRISRWLKDVGTVVAVVCVLIILSELLLRVSFGRRVLIKHEFYSNLLGDFSPNLNIVDNMNANLRYKFHTNSQGMRGNEVDIQNKDRKIRILCVGDSFTEGVGVDDQFTYPSVLEGYLTKKYPSERIEVINAGFFMYDIVDELDYYLKKGVRLNPDLVIVQFFSNDLDLIPQGNFFRPSHDHGQHYSPVSQEIFNSSTFYYASLLSYELKKIMRRLGLDEFKDSRSLEYLKYTATGFKGDISLVSDKSKFLDERNDEQNKILWEKYKSALLDLYKAVCANNSKFLFVIVPDRTQIKEFYNSPSSNLISFLKMNDIPFVDLTKLYRKVDAEQCVELYNYPYDMHFNAVGNTLMASAIGDKIHLVEGHGVEIDRSEEPYFFDYRNPVRMTMDFTDNGFRVHGVSDIRVENVQFLNIKKIQADFLGKKIDFFQSATPNTEDGKAIIKISSKDCIKHIATTTFRKLYEESAGCVLYEYSLDGINYSLIYQYDKSKGDFVGFENQYLFELGINNSCVKDVFFRFRFNGRGSIMSEEEEQKFRRFEAVIYN